MARFIYTAEKGGGEVYHGVATALDRFELYRIIRREGGRLIALKEDRSQSPWSFTHWSEKFSTIKEYDKILFARNLGVMISAGLALARALAVLERQTRNPRLARTIGEIASSVRHGDAFNVALSQFPRAFPKLFTAMVRAGEEGGELPQSLSVIADQMERVHALKKKVRGALIYPTIVLCAIIGVGVLMLTEVVPTLAKTFKEMGADLPASTQAVIVVSDFLVSYTVVALGILIALIFFFYAIVHTAHGKRTVDFLLLRMPLIGPMVREVNAARTMRTLSSLLSSGIDVLGALAITRDVVQNSYFKDVIEQASKKVAQGEPLSSSFARYPTIYPPFVGEMIAVGEETGALNDMMKRVALFYEDEVDRKTKDLSTIIEPLLMVVVGIAVGFFAVAMVSPIYQLSSIA